MRQLVKVQVLLSAPLFVGSKEKPIGQESVISTLSCGRLNRLELLTYNRRVGGSIPPRRTSHRTDGHSTLRDGAVASELRGAEYKSIWASGIW